MYYSALCIIRRRWYLVDSQELRVFRKVAKLLFGDFGYVFDLLTDQATSRIIRT